MQGMGVAAAIGTLGFEYRDRSSQPAGSPGQVGFPGKSILGPAGKAVLIAWTPEGNVSQSVVTRKVGSLFSC